MLELTIVLITLILSDPCVTNEVESQVSASQCIALTHAIIRVYWRAFAIQNRIPTFSIATALSLNERFKRSLKRVRQLSRQFAWMSETVQLVYRTLNFPTRHFEFRTTFPPFRAAILRFQSASARTISLWPGFVAIEPPERIPKPAFARIEFNE